MLRSLNTDTIRVGDKKFAISVPASKIQQEVERVAAEISRDYSGREPLFLVVLNGAFVFAADLLRAVTLESQVSFVKLSSYNGADSEGKVRELIGLGEDVRGRELIVVEDIVDTGLTMSRLLETLKAHEPASVDICTLLLKPGKLQTDLKIRYRAMEIPDDFVVGYGLDYDGRGRNLRDIYSIINE